MNRSQRVDDCNREEGLMAINETDSGFEKVKPVDSGRVQAEQRLANAQDWKPPGDQLSDNPARGAETFRYYDSELRGEVRTGSERPQALEQLSVARIHDRDGNVRPAGSLRYAIDPDDCTLRGYATQPANFGVESALLSETSEQAHAQGKDSMRVWVPDGDPDGAKQWSRHGFQLEAQRAPGAAGSYWHKRI
jgi:hypothetical protein